MPDEFEEVALDTAKRLRQKDGSLAIEQETLEHRLFELKEMRKSIRKVDARLKSYDPAAYECPVCFVKDNIGKKMKAISSKTERDKFKCRECGIEIEVNA